MSMKCDATFKDPFFKGKKCDKKAKYMIKLESNDDYIHPRCGTHSKRENKIELYPKKNNKNNNISEKKQEQINGNEDKNGDVFNFNELLKYIENEEWKKKIPQEVQNLFDEIDKLNNNIYHICNM